MLMPGWRIARVRNHGRIVLDQDGIVNDSKSRVLQSGFACLSQKASFTSS